MSGKKSKKRKEQKKNDGGFLKSVTHDLIVSVVGTLIVSVFMGIAAYFQGFLTLPETVENLEKRIVALETNNVPAEKKDSSNEEKNKEVNINVEVTGMVKMEEEVNNFAFLSPLSFDDESKLIGVDNSGEKYSAEDLIGETFLIPYKEENQDILFYGQYSKDYQWDGNCLLNVYVKNKLVLLTEAEYDNGKLLSYKQIKPDTTTRGDYVWSFSKRENKGKYNSGVSWNYFWKEDYVQKFKLEDASKDDLVTYKQFKSQIDKTLEGYYCGNTSGGYYNDKTGQAYLVKYAKDGTVRTLYKGRFKKGQFNDKTGNAWYIVRDEEKETNYMYYKGKFKEGKPDESRNKDNFENPVSKERILEIIKKFNFKCKLKWHE